MRVAVQKWGNSLALRIPKGLADEVGVRQGTEVDVTVREGRLVAAPVVHVPTLEELLACFDDADAASSEDLPGAVGREAWPDDPPRGWEVLDPWPAGSTPRARGADGR